MRAQQIIELEREAILRLPYGRGTSVACVQGVIWVTSDNDPNDLILEPGQAFTLCGSGTVICALHPARVAIEASGTSGMEAAARLLHAEALARLSHGAVATIKGVCARITQ